MKNSVILLILVLFAIQTHAEEPRLHIFLKSGNKVCISIADQPKIQFEDGVMYVGSETFLVSNVSKYQIGTDESVSVGEIAAGGMMIDASQAAQGLVRIANYKGEEVKMYSAGGVEVPCDVATTSSSAVINFSASPAGVYVLSVGNENFKIQKQ